MSDCFAERKKRLFHNALATIIQGRFIFQFYMDVLGLFFQRFSIQTICKELTELNTVMRALFQLKKCLQILGRQCAATVNSQMACFMRHTAYSAI